MNPRTKRKRKSKGTKQISSGIVDMTKEGSAYIVCDDNSIKKDIFVPSSKMLNALHGDRVSVAWYLSKSGKPKGEVIRVLKRQKEQFVGTLIVARQSRFVLPDDPNLLVDITVAPRMLSRAKHGDKVLVGINQWHSPEGLESPTGEIKAILGKSGTSDAEMQAILIRHGFNITFSEKVLKENEAVAEIIPQKEIKRRLDLRKVTTFTVDPDTAKDFDDALSLRLLESGNYEIGVHIADVSHYVAEGSALDKEALHRTTSVYLVDRVCPMLPEKLSNGVCSLRPREDKLTFSVLFEFSPKGDLLSEWFGKTVICSNHRFTYNTAQHVLETGQGKYARELRLLNNFAHKMRRERFKKGALRFETPEVQFKLDQQGLPISVDLKERKDAHMLVEDFMLLANKRVAAFIYNLPKEGKPIVPFVYRVHDSPDMGKVAELADFAKNLGYELKTKSVKQVTRSLSTMLSKAIGTAQYNVLQQLVIRTMAKASYSTDNIGHYGLAFEHYSHFTSPIRRYADVLVHRVLHQYLQTGKCSIQKKLLESYCNRISNIERKAVEAERESIKYKQTEFLQSRVGNIFEGTISGITDRGIFVEIKSNRCEGLVHFAQMYDAFSLAAHGMSIRSASRVYKMGDTVWIKVLSADLKRRHIDMQLLDERLINTTALATVKSKKMKKVLVKENAYPQKEDKITGENHTAIEENPIFESLLQEANSIFDHSAIKTYAQRYKKEWNYQVIATAVHQKTVMVLTFNWQAVANRTYPAQTAMPEVSILEAENGSLATLMPFAQQYLPKAPLNKMTWCALSCFRSKAENQISASDVEMGLPIFERLLQFIQPKIILCLSSRVRDFFEAKGILTHYKEKTLKAGRREIVVAQGTLKQTYGRTKVYFLPHPKKRLASAVRKQAWEWALVSKK